MSINLQLYIPDPVDGWFYVQMLSDPETMAYNARWFPPDGCIPEPEAEWHDLQAHWIGKEPERGKGYGKQGLLLLLERAFKVDCIARLHNEFETTRREAYLVHKAVGFRDMNIVDGIVQLELTRNEYMKNSLKDLEKN